MKYDQIAEAYITILIEGKIDDLKKQNPHLSNEIDQYSNADPTPQKKFVPWLVSQHKKGNLTPDDADINTVLRLFEKYKTKHKIKQHTDYDFDSLKNEMFPLAGLPNTQKENTYSGIDKIYDDNKIQAFYVKTKDASQNLYGGGEELGGLHTDWCVSARGDNCLFGKYGDMYTVHVNGDKNSPYAIHIKKGDNILTTRHNVPHEYHLESALTSDKFKHLRPAVNSIFNHSENLNNITEKILGKSDRDVSKEDIESVLNNNIQRHDVISKILKSPNITDEHLNKILDTKNPTSIHYILDNKNIKKYHIIKAANILDEYDPLTRHINNPVVKQMIDEKNTLQQKIKNKLESDSDLHNAIKSYDYSTNMMALSSDKIKPEHITTAINSNKPSIRVIAALHPLANKNHVNKALSDEDPSVRSDVINKLKNPSRQQIDNAIKDKEFIVRLAAKENPKYKEFYPNGDNK